MANPRKPQRLKELEGTARADRDYGEPDLPVATSLEPPTTLVSPEAVRVWKKIIAVLHPVRVISEADLMALTHLCNLHAHCIRLWEAGEAPKAAELTQLRLYFQEFGLTPASRSRASQIGEQSTDPAEEFFSGPQLAQG